MIEYEVVARADAVTAVADVKRTAALRREARGVLRRLDVLMAAAAAIEDPALPAIGELRSVAERLVAQLAHREQAQQR